MTLAKLITSLRAHMTSFPEDREATEKVILWIEKHGEFAFVKANLEGHLTGSMIITNPERTKVLLMLHKKFQRWQQFGGHCDGETDVLAVAKREFHEESGITIDPVLDGDIFLCEAHDVPLDKKGTPPHIHYDIMYHGVVPEDTPFIRQESEVDDIRWFKITDIEEYLEPEMYERILRLNSQTR